MPLLKQYAAGNMAVWKIEESEQQLLDTLQRKELILPTLENLRAPRRRLEWLATRCLLKQLLGEETPITYRESGAPLLPLRSESISISHSHEFVAIRLSQAQQTAIDIECHGDKAFRLRERFMNPQELQSLHPDTQTTQALLCWSAKEVLFKLLDNESVDFAAHLHLAPFPIAEHGTIYAHETRSANGASFTLDYFIDSHFVLVWHRD
ncbi:4'-phosphopantetheinyl transferase superfamily protein [Parabacteroides sp. OttesenSCG-928-N08]|nr:4'-phosphopantetheinyl transferase superfamily protein [Parabacteroides sp. OttesenSCG-928-N08]